MNALLDVGLALAQLGTETVTISRMAAGSYTLGRWTDGATSTFDISASVQPLNPREIQDLPENRRFTESLKLYTETELRAGSVNSSTQPDEFTRDGKDYEILSVAKWPAATTFYKAVAVVKGQGG